MERNCGQKGSYNKADISNLGKTSDMGKSEKVPIKMRRVSAIRTKNFLKIVALRKKSHLEVRNIEIISACPKYSEHFPKRENPIFQTVFATMGKYRVNSSKIRISKRS